MVSGTGLITGDKVTMATDMLQPALHTGLRQMVTEISSSRSAKTSSAVYLRVLIYEGKMYPNPDDVWEKRIL